MRDGDVFQDLDGVISLVDFDQYHHPHLAVGALQPPPCIRPELSKGFWIPCLYNEDRPWVCSRTSDSVRPGELPSLAE